MAGKEQLFDAIEDSYKEVIPHSAMYELDRKLAATNCESIVEDVNMRFSNYLKDNFYIIEHSYIKNDDEECMRWTIKDLFQLFKKENNL